jgi:DUF1365 family protein
MTASALYFGTVRHRRVAERPRSFEHGLTMAYLDLDELPSLLGGRLVSPRPGIVRFRRADYFGAGDLAAAVRARVATETGTAPDGPVRLLTQLRSFGHCFNPVSFYYCFDREEHLEALLAEVTNTPWGERHAYVLARGPERGRVLTGESAKLLHVSPFFGMDQRYAWRVAQPGTTLSVHIENHERGRRAFDATLNMKRRELTPRSLTAATMRYPCATLRILALIYGHAAAIRLSGVQARPHPPTPYHKGVEGYPKPQGRGTVPYQ